MFLLNFPEGLPEQEVAPGVVFRVAWGERLMAAHCTIEPRGTMPLHSHPHEEMEYILEGEFRFTLGSETVTLRKGDAYLALANIEHGGTSGDQGAVILAVFSPPREEYKLKGAGERYTPPGH